MLRVEDLRKSFGAVKAVDGVSFSLAAGSATALVGESGSGKSTISRLLVGLESADSGRITLLTGASGAAPPTAGSGGWPARRRQRRRALARQVQMVFQDPFLSLDPRIRVGDSIAEVLDRHFSLTTEAKRRRVRELLEQVGLGGREERALPRMLSGGQRQRVAIARALAVEPRVLILDEATSSLDVSIQAQIIDLLVTIRKETGVTMLFVSHDLALVRQITDEVIVLFQGRIVEHGPTAKILAHPSADYTRLLLSSVPRPGWDPTQVVTLRQALRQGE